MANPPPDGIHDDFFEQIFSMPASYATARDGGALGYGDSSASSGFSLGLSLDNHQNQQQGQLEDGGKRILNDDDQHSDGREPPVQLASLFPPFGHSPVSQGRPNPPPFQVLATHGTVNAAPHHPAPRPRVRARRGQATDPHSIAERLRRERIAERIRALQELVPTTNKTDRALMLDEIVDYVKFLRLQVKVLSMSRLGGAGAVAQLVADIPMSSVQVGEASEAKTTPQVWEKWSTDGTERQVAELMEEDIGAAMRFLQSQALCIMPISLAAAIYHTQPRPEASSVKPEPSNPS
ncbi:uncharacterized protein A4U43_C07F25750 [Asparagus officinalis]|uniref:BHLH domain-containing protein n=1 Tax=Asparagus officinalis TaxID=4686 RepID=A0A5P1EF07_ASPOF|nr:transcription factor UNE12-like [Asparagus officinalis]ONK64424.1 uncharacterized protein A4U43_C07F25750 [Asparagus officinalis]